MERRKRNTSVLSEDTSITINTDRPGFLKLDAMESLGIAEYKPQSGEDGKALDHQIHVIPANEKDSDRYGLELFIHYDVGPQNAVVLCPKYMKAVYEAYKIDVPESIKDARCPICDEEQRLLKESFDRRDKGEDTEDIWEVRKKLLPYYGSYKEPKPKRYLVWVRDATSEATEDEGTKLFLMSKTVYDEGLMEKTTSRRGGSGPIDIADPDNGYYFYFKREGIKWSEVKYKGFDIEKRDFAIPDEWMNTPQYNDVLIIRSYDEITTLLGNMTDADFKEDVVDVVEEPVQDEAPRLRPRRDTDNAKPEVVVGEPVQDEAPRLRPRRNTDNEKPEVVVEEEGDFREVRDAVRSRRSRAQGTGQEEGTEPEIVDDVDAPSGEDIPF